MNLPDVIQTLETKREHLSIAIDVLKALGHSMPAQTAAPALIEAPAAPPGGERKRRKPRVMKTVKVAGNGRASSAMQCAKHPDSDFDKFNRCRQCQRDYQKEYARKKKEKAAAPGVPYSKRAHMPGPKPKPHVPALDDIDPGDADLDDVEFTDEQDERPPTPAPIARRFMWSKPVRCPKCGEHTRLRRLATADLKKDAWIHPGPSCAVKIALYQIKDDPKYVGAEAVAAPPHRRSE